MTHKQCSQVKRVKAALERGIEKFFLSPCIPVSCPAGRKEEPQQVTKRETETATVTGAGKEENTEHMLSSSVAAATESGFSNEKKVKRSAYLGPVVRS